VDVGFVCSVCLSSKSTLSTGDVCKLRRTSANEGNSILRTEPTRQSLLDVWLVSVTTGRSNQHPGSDC
jgi:hypothetical protein